MYYQAIELAEVYEYESAILFLQVYILISPDLFGQTGDINNICYTYNEHYFRIS
jgi:hypothetical protein